MMTFIVLYLCCGQCTSCHRRCCKAGRWTWNVGASQQQSARAADDA